MKTFILTEKYFHKDQSFVDSERCPLALMFNDVLPGWSNPYPRYSVTISRIRDRGKKVFGYMEAPFDNTEFEKLHKKAMNGEKFKKEVKLIRFEPY